LREKASRDFQAKLFRDAKRKHQEEEQQKRFNLMDEEEREREAKRVRARAADPFNQDELNNLIGCIKNNGKPNKDGKQDQLSNIDDDDDDNDHYQDLLNASFVDGAGEKNNLGSSGPSVMVKMADIPTIEEFVPGEPSYNKVLNYVRDCENKRQKLRVENWPRKLVNAINFQYRHTFRTYQE
jgi:hypothetical protein